MEYSQLEVDSKLVGKCLGPGPHTHARTHRRTDNPETWVSVVTSSNFRQQYRDRVRSRQTRIHVHGGPRSGATDSVKILTDLNKFFSLEDSCKFAVKWIFKIAPHLAYVATLPCETLMSAKQVINDKIR